MLSSICVRECGIYVTALFCHIIEIMCLYLANVSFLMECSLLLLLFFLLVSFVMIECTQIRMMAKTLVEAGRGSDIFLMTENSSQNCSSKTEKRRESRRKFNRRRHQKLLQILTPSRISTNSLDFFRWYEHIHSQFLSSQRKASRLKCHFTKYFMFELTISISELIVTLHFISFSVIATSVHVNWLKSLKHSTMYGEKCREKLFALNRTKMSGCIFRVKCIIFGIFTLYSTSFFASHLPPHKKCLERFRSISECCKFQFHDYYISKYVRNRNSVGYMFTVRYIAISLCIMTFFVPRQHYHFASPFLSHTNFMPLCRFVYGVSFSLQ